MSPKMSPQKALTMLVMATGTRTRQLTFQASLFRRGILVNSQTERAARFLDDLQTATLVLQEMINRQAIDA